MRKLILTCAAAALCSTAASADNLVVNGSFTDGNSGFTSDYAFSPGGNGTEGQYTVRTNPYPWNPAFASFGDNTTGTGNMMVINGSPIAGAVVWSSGLINITANTNYFFEAFVANVCCEGAGINPPSLTFSYALNGGPAQSLVTLGVPADPVGNWIGLTSNFNSAANTSVQLFLVNANTIAQGNDFAIDDINLDTRSIVTAAPEPATWMMMIVGFGAAGTALRIRRRPTLAIG